MGELEADIRVQLAFTDGIEELVVKGGAGAGLFDIGHVLAQVVDGDASASAIDRLCRSEHLLDLCASYEATRHALTNRGALGDSAQPAAL